jgi:hypothetical protein
MATKDTIEIDVNVGEGVKSMKTLKKEFAEMQTELDGLVPGTQKYIETLQRLGAVKDEIGDLKAEIQAFAGTDAKVAAFGNVIGGVASGFQAAQGAAALLGAESEEVQKALLKVQAASALADGIKGITAMGDSLKVAGNVAKQLITQILGVETVTKIAAAAQRIWNAVMAANPIMLMVVAITALVGAAVLLANAFDDSKSATEEYIEQNKKLIEQSKETVKSIDNEILALSGLAANEKEIIKLKRERILETQKQAQLDALNAQAQASKDKELDWYQKIGAAVLELQTGTDTRLLMEQKNAEASNKLLKEKVDLVKSSAAELQAFDNQQKQKAIDDKAAADKAAADKAKAAADKAKAAAQKEIDEDIKRRKEANEAKEKAIQHHSNISINIAEEEKKAKLKQQQEQADAEYAIEVDKQKKRDELIKKAEEDEIKSKEAIKEAEGKSIDAMQGVSAAFFAFKLRGAKGNAAEELKIRKQQFAVDKAFNIARAIQDGIRSVQAALTIPPPGGQILAVVNATIAAANVAKLAASQFEGGSTGDIGSVNVSTPGTFTQAPNVGGGGGNNQTALNPDGSVNKQGQPSVIKAYVVESESAEVSKRVNKLSEQSKI